jgi:hypothetical protein
LQVDIFYAMCHRRKDRKSQAASGGSKESIFA